MPSISEEKWPQQQNDPVETPARPISPTSVNDPNDEGLIKKVRLNSPQEDQVSLLSDDVGSFDHEEDHEELEIVDKSPMHDAIKHDQVMTELNEVAPAAS